MIYVSSKLPEYPGMVRTLFFFLTFPWWTLLMLAASFIFSFRGPDAIFRCGQIYSRGCLRLAGVKVICRTCPEASPEGAVIYMPNHASLFDIPALMTCIDHPFRWVAKKELFRIPFFATALRAAGTVCIDRRHREKAFTSLNQAAERLRDGESFTIFPEGTRSPNGRLLPFKKGGFMTAVHAQVPIIPVAIRGSAAVLPKHRMRIHPGVIEVQLLPDLSTRGLTDKDRGHLMEKVRLSLVSALASKKGAL